MYYLLKKTGLALAFALSAVALADDSCPTKIYTPSIGGTPGIALGGCANQTASGLPPGDPVGTPTSVTPSASGVNYYFVVCKNQTSGALSLEWSWTSLAAARGECYPAGKPVGLPVSYRYTGDLDFAFPFYVSICERSID